MKKLLLLTVLVTFVGLSEVKSQCPMCRGAVETSIKQGSERGRGLNKGILYLLAMPYIAAATFGVIWYKRKKSANP
jgi:hypothetical protein